MAYTLACADTGAECPGLFTTETKEELFKHAEIHAEAAHPDLEITDEQVEALIKQA